MWCNYNIGVWIKKNIGISFELILNTFFLANKLWKKDLALGYVWYPKIWKENTRETKQK